MPKDFTYHILGFYKPQLTVQFISFEIIRKCICFSEKNQQAENYDIVFIDTGKFSFICNGVSFELKPGDIFISRPFENYTIIGLDNKNTSKITHISFSQSLFNEYNSENRFLRPFTDKKRGFNIYKSDEFEDFSVYNLINRLRIYYSKKLPLEAFVLATGTLITEIGIIFDKKNSILSPDFSEEYMLRVYDYITSNCFNDITAQEVMKKFSVSRWYVDKVTKKFYGFSFGRTIKDIRMWQAQKYMEKNIELKEVATLCGFENYSGFFRAYKSFFGVSPSDDLKYYKTHSYFNSRNWFKK